MSFEFVRLS